MEILSKNNIRSHPDIMTTLELIKPITWFPPMWAFLCGAVSTGLIQFENMGYIFLGIILSGPIVCGMSQAANDWCDRHVDAINEPSRPIPSGRMPGKWGLGIAIAMTILSLIIGWFLGMWGFIATITAVACAWLYSAEPFRFKKSGIVGPFLVGLCYEGLPWFTGAAVLSIGIPRSEIIIIAILYAIGAFGIMTLNDFKAIQGDKQMGVNSLPVMLGEKSAAKLACVVMIIPQIIVVWFLFNWNLFLYSFFIIISLGLQIAAMKKLLKDPAQFAPWYNRTGITLYVFGMMVSATALGSRTEIT